MLPTLLVGDYLYVWNGYYDDHEPKRGDIVVFKLPRDNSIFFIERLVGLPGDQIQMRDGVLYINDEEVRRERIEDFIAEDRRGAVRATTQYIETMLDGTTFRTLDIAPTSAADNTRIFTVRAGHYFMMGDNRDNSLDSRFVSGVGQVPAENLVGGAEVLFYSTNGKARWWEIWLWPSTTRFSRLFQSVSGI